ncbi:MAG: PhoX family protein [Pseudanabaenaceae cyanobacterium]
MSYYSRRQFLTFFGASAAAAVLGDVLLNQGAVAKTGSTLTFTPVRLPSPLPIYLDNPSFLATGYNGQGTVLPPSDNAGRLASFTVVDDVVVPPEYEYYPILAWGDRVFPNPDDYFGYNCDFNGYIPINGNNEGYLYTNHEYVSGPFSPVLRSSDVTDSTFREVIGFDIPTTRTRALLGELAYNLGGSVVRIRRDANGRFRPVNGDNRNRRYHLLSGLAINAERTDAYRTVTSWGERSHQRGDNNFLIGTGPAARDVFEGVNADGLGNRIIGTGFNCSGGVSPWGTVFSCEENFQASTASFNGVQEDTQPNGTQTGYIPQTTGAEFGLVGEKYGWVVEIDPADPNFRARKHTALGRFRWENITFRAEAGKRLVAYMGCDRRGGHTYKYVSNGTITNPTDKANSRLLEDGRLYAALYKTDGTGEWLLLDLSTPTNPLKPSEIASVELAALGTAQQNGRVRLPRRNGIAGQTVNGGSFIVDLTNEAAVLADYQGKRLSDFYRSQGAMLVDAHLAANLIGASPTPRPEDLEVNPRNPREVFVAYTDNAPGSDGYADSRIFQVSKQQAAVDAVQSHGALFKIIEDSEDSTGLTFRWERLAQGGEAGSQQGAGFANVDNLAFDNQGNLWCVTDMSTGAHNGFGTGLADRPNTMNHNATGNIGALTGVFGNNFIFVIKLDGPDAGLVLPFGYGPNRSECTGPWFVGDTLLLSVQHPGEDEPVARGQIRTRTIPMLDLNGQLYNQTRRVTAGSNFPTNRSGAAPKPTVVGIRRKQPLPNGNFI